MSTIPLLSSTAHPLPVPHHAESTDGTERTSSLGEFSFAELLLQAAETAFAPTPPGDGSSTDAQEGSASDAGAPTAAEGPIPLQIAVGLAALQPSGAGGEPETGSARSATSLSTPALPSAREAAPSFPAVENGGAGQETAEMRFAEATGADGRPTPGQRPAGQMSEALPVMSVAATEGTDQPVVRGTALRQNDGAGVPHVNDATPRQAVDGRLLQVTDAAPGIGSEVEPVHGGPVAEEIRERLTGFGAVGQLLPAEADRHAGMGVNAAEGKAGRAAQGSFASLLDAAHRPRSGDPAAGNVTADGRPSTLPSADVAMAVSSPRDAGLPGVASAADPVPVERFAEQATPVLLRALRFGTGGQAVEARLHLVPEQLGKVDVQLVVHNGHVTIAFAVDTSAAKEVLESQLPQLRWQLEQHGLIVDRVVVNQGTSGGLAFFHGFSHGHRGTLPHPQSPVRRAQTAYGGEEAAEALPAVSVHPAGERASRVDYSV